VILAREVNEIACCLSSVRRGPALLRHQKTGDSDTVFGIGSTSVKEGPAGFVAAQVGRQRSARIENQRQRLAVVKLQHFMLFVKIVPLFFPQRRFVALP
jgi:hypothetical protein